MTITYVASQKWDAVNQKMDNTIVTVGVGTTVALGSTYIGDGKSSFYATYYDAETDTFKSPSYGSTYCYGDRTSNAKVDAPAELIKMWQERVRKAEGERAERARREYRLREYRHGDKVRVVKGRKVPVGTEGVIFFKRAGDYGVTLGISPSGVKGSNGLYNDAVWVALNNCEVLLDE